MESRRYNLHRKLKSSMKVKRIKTVLEGAGINMPTKELKRNLSKACKLGMMKSTKQGFKMIKIVCDNHVRDMLGSGTQNQLETPCFENLSSCSNLRSPTISHTRTIVNNFQETDMDIPHNEEPHCSLQVHSQSMQPQKSDGSLKLVAKAKTPSSSQVGENTDGNGETGQDEEGNRGSVCGELPSEDPIVAPPTTTEEQPLDHVLEECWTDVHKFLQLLEHPVPSCHDSLDCVSANFQK